MNMKTIEVFEVGDQVFWLNSQGFQKGWVKTVSYVQHESGQVQMKVYCTTSEVMDTYQGDVPDKVFRSCEGMLTYYWSRLTNEDITGIVINSKSKTKKQRKH